MRSPILPRLSAMLLALSLPLFAAGAAEFPETFVSPPVMSAPSSHINLLLPVAPTNGLDQRLVPSLSAPRSGLITVTPAAALGVLPGDSPAGCTIGTEGVAIGLARGTCANVANFPKGNDLLN